MRLQTLLALCLVMAPTAFCAETLSDLMQFLEMDDFQERQRAAQRLTALPASAIPQIEAELRRRGLSPEVRRHLETALPTLRKKHAGAMTDTAEQQLLDLNRKTLRDAYMAVGKKDPKWDANALDALDHAATFFTYPYKRTTRLTRTIEARARQAIADGCDDGLIHYLYARMADDLGSEKPAILQQKYEQSALKMREAKYPPNRQYFAWARSFKAVKSVSRRPLARANQEILNRLVTEAVALIPEMEKSPLVSRDHVYEACVDCIDLMQWMGMDRLEAYNKITGGLPASFNGGAIGLSVKGDMLVSYAWDARGNGWANTVTEDGWAKMRERLTQARETFEKSYKLNPAFGPTSTRMLSVELGDSRGREAMELWYGRARLANLRDVSPCSAKMYWLHPKWHGTPEDMLAFGRELVKEGLWEQRIPFQLVEAHKEIATYGNEGADQALYYQKAGVFADLKSVYEPYIDRYPDSYDDRNRYAFLAGLCNQWTVVDTQLKRLKDRVDPDYFGGEETLELFRRKASEAAGAKK